MRMKENDEVKKKKERKMEERKRKWAKEWKTQQGRKSYCSLETI